MVIIINFEDGLFQAMDNVKQVKAANHNLYVVYNDSSKRIFPLVSENKSECVRSVKVNGKIAYNVYDKLIDLDRMMESKFQEDKKKNV